LVRPLTGSGGTLDNKQLANFVQRYGDFISDSLLDADFQLFAAPGIDGVIGYKVAWGNAVSLGGPLCSSADKPKLMAAFRNFCAKKKWSAAYVYVGQDTMQYALKTGMAVLEAGCEHFVDPHLKSNATLSGPSFQKLVARGSKGVTFHEVNEQNRAEVTGQLGKLFSEWRTRHNGAMHANELDPFSARNRRWFYASRGQDIVGLLTTSYRDSYQAPLVDSIVISGSTSTGLSEALHYQALQAFAKDGATRVSMGGDTAPRLGILAGLPAWLRPIASSAYDWIQHRYPSGKERFRHKFGPLQSEPRYVIADPRISLGVVFSVLKAVHFSLGHALHLWAQQVQHILSDWWQRTRTALTPKPRGVQVKTPEPPHHANRRKPAKPTRAAGRTA